MASVKKRAIPFVSGGGTARRREYRRPLGSSSSGTLAGEITNDGNASAPHLQGTQVTESESHGDWRLVDRPPGDVGGNFTMKKTSAFCPIGRVHHESPWQSGASYAYRFVYDGPVCLDQVRLPSTTFPPFAISSDTALNAFGAAAVARCAPTEPTANLATALLEVYREGLPKMFGKTYWEKGIKEEFTLRSQAQASSSEFLNYQFGMLPIVSDCRDFVKAVRNMDKLLQQYIRDNGNVVRRRYSLPPEERVEESVISSNAFMFMGINGAPFFNFSPPNARVIRRRETSVRRWFSGAFVYHLPQSFFAEMYSPFASDFQVYRKILGLELNLETLWQLAPWSWAVDWFTSVGDVITNANSWINDGLVMKYGYIMEHSIVRDTYTYVGPSRLLGGSNLRPSDLTLVSEAKVRRRANPFGFGLSMDGLSNLQKTILAAVGLSRLK